MKNRNEDNVVFTIFQDLTKNIVVILLQSVFVRNKKSPVN